VVPLPDLDERLPILEVHSKDKPLDASVDLSMVARGTPGMSGADLANLAERVGAARRAAHSKTISMEDFESARDRVMMGQLRDTMVLMDDERERVAFHESGHALVGLRLEKTDPLHKITIIPRGLALGVTMTLPEEDRHIMSRQYLEDSLCMRMGGRVAELLVYGDLSTGAADDLQRNTELAIRMVREWGMSKEIGPMAWGSNNQVFLGEDLMHTRDYSDHTSQIIDDEVERILREQESRAIEVLTLHRRGFESLARALLEHETLDGDDRCADYRRGHGEQVHPEGTKTVSSLVGVGATSATRKSPAPVTPAAPPLPGWQPPTLPSV
jgi:cell division protease FtsH